MWINFKVSFCQQSSSHLDYIRIAVAGFNFNWSLTFPHKGLTPLSLHFPRGLQQGINKKYTRISSNQWHTATVTLSFLQPLLSAGFCRINRGNSTKKIIMQVKCEMSSLDYGTQQWNKGLVVFCKESARITVYILNI